MAHHDTARLAGVRPARLTVATDGGCYPNPGPWGWAWAAEDGTWACGAGSLGTNNLAELNAIRMALEAHPRIPLRIVYDSQYAANSVTVWGHNWIRKRQTSRPNFDLIKMIIDLIAERPDDADIEWVWVKGHQGHELNERADQLASRMVKIGVMHHEWGTSPFDGTADFAAQREGSRP